MLKIVRYTINPSFQWDDELNKYVPVSGDVYFYCGPVDQFGGGSSQSVANPAEEATANAGANAQAQAAANLSNTYNQEQQQNYSKLFGTPASSTSTGTTGTLSQFMNPSSLNVSQPTGAYALQYKQATGNLAQQTAAQRGALAQTMQNSGFGTNSPSGMGQDAALQLGLGQNAQQGQLFTQAATNSYNDALNNFWNATNIAAGQAATSQAGALAGTATAAQTDTNLSSTATAPYTTVTQSPIGAALGAAGSMGSAAIGKCYIAAAVFNEDFETGFFTGLVRDWLWNIWAKNWYAKPVLWAYGKWGKWGAQQKLIVNMLRPLFIMALAEAWKERK